MNPCVNARESCPVKPYASTVHAPASIPMHNFNVHTPSVNHIDAVRYIAHVKQRFAQFPEKYETFVSILHWYQLYRQEDGVVQQVVEQVTRLFEGYPDLLYQFGRFLPEGSLEEYFASVIHVSSPELIPFGANLNTPTIKDAMVYLERVKIVF
jgi:histone deacetylase complex regulatory component SIN3